MQKSETESLARLRRELSDLGVPPGDELVLPIEGSRLTSPAKDFADLAGVRLSHMGVTAVFGRLEGLPLSDGGARTQRFYSLAALCEWFGLPEGKVRAAFWARDPRRLVAEEQHPHQPEPWRPSVLTTTHEGREHREPLYALVSDSQGHLVAEFKESIHAIDERPQDVANAHRARLAVNFCAGLPMGVLEAMEQHELTLIDVLHLDVSRLMQEEGLRSVLRELVRRGRAGQRRVTVFAAMRTDWGGREVDALRERFRSRSQRLPTEVVVLSNGAAVATYESEPRREDFPSLSQLCRAVGLDEGDVFSKLKLNWPVNLPPQDDGTGDSSPPVPAPKGVR